MSKVLDISGAHLESTQTSMTEFLREMVNGFKLTGKSCFFRDKVVQCNNTVSKTFKQLHQSRYSSNLEQTLGFV